MKKIIFSIAAAIMLMGFISCSSGDDSNNSLLMTLVNSNSSTGTQPGNPSEPVNPPEPTPTDPAAPEKDIAPLFDSRSAALDYIFGTDQLAITKISITREQWNKLLEYYDMNNRNETCVHADYSFEKGDKKWNLEDVGIRIRGNTSRVRPQVNDKYVQSHFKVDFEEWPVMINGEEVERERKMAGCMKGVILKRFKDDGTFSREIFGYNYFRDCGIWTAPRAGYTRLLLDIIEDDGSIEKVDYGVYAMIENIDKQMLKERTKKEKGGKYDKNSGNLWKCTGWANFYNIEESHFGVEYIDLDDSKSQRFSYDLKTNKGDIAEAKSAFRKWLKELNNLNDFDVDQIKAWYESNMNVDLFLKTYAVNVILGMWDDYWVNQNNFYFYFDTDGKAYFIPYDYDNILGTNGCGVDAAKQNPLEWGSLTDHTKPLMQKIMRVPEFVEKYREYLLEFSNSSSGFDSSKAIPKIMSWQNMIGEYISAKNYTDGVCKLVGEPYFNDVPANWGNPYIEYKVLSGDENTNYFKVRQRSIQKYCKKCSVTFNLNGGRCSEYSGDSVTVEVGKGIYITNIISAEKDGYRFCGWTRTLNGTDYVQSVSEDTELYASWVEENIIPYAYNPATHKYKIIFRPEHFGFDKETYSGNIKFVCDSTGWNANPMDMYKDNETKWYVVEVSNLGGWYGFKFYDDGTWYGYEEFNQKQLPELFAEYSSNKNFIIPELK